MEWLLAAGASSNKASYVYLTSSTSGPLAFRYADLAVAIPPQAFVLSAALFDASRLYLGVGGVKPTLVALRASPNLPGLDATTTDVVDLDLDDLPAVGGNHTLVDALAKYQGRLYVANAGGIACANVDPPSGSGDFAHLYPLGRGLDRRIVGRHLEAGRPHPGRPRHPGAHHLERPALRGA